MAPKRPDREILEEILGLVRGMTAGFSTSGQVFVVGPGTGFERTIYRIPSSILSRYGIESVHLAPIPSPPGITEFELPPGPDQGRRVEETVRDLMQNTSAAAKDPKK